LTRSTEEYLRLLLIEDAGGEGGLDVEDVTERLLTFPVMEVSLLFDEEAVMEEMEGDEATLLPLELPDP
jgi:hypothetical protein